MNILHKIGNGVYKAGLAAVRGLTLILLGVLTLCSLFWGYYAEEMVTQASIPHREPVLLHLACMALLLLLLYPLLRLSRSGNRFKSLLLALALGLTCFWGLFLILFGRSLPTADSASVYAIAQSLASGQTGVIHPTGSYLSYYPQQIGLVAFYEGIIRLWNLLPVSYAAYHILQCVNVALACAIVYFQYRTVCLLPGGDEAAVAYLFLSLLNAPLVVYTSFVYGEIPSFAFLSGGIYLLLRFFYRPSPHRKSRLAVMACSLLMLTAAAALRKNSLIVIIAIVLVILWEWLRTHRHRLLLWAGGLALCCAVVLPAIQKVYEFRAGNTLSTGVPALSYIAMGMQESDRGRGWDNGFNFYTYEASNMDSAVTAQKSKAAIRASLEAFRADPGYALDFYADKFLSQWTDGSYFCRQATQNHTDGRIRIVKSLYEGELSPAFNHFCNVYQLLVYGGALICLAGMRRRGEEHPSLLPYVGLVAVLGGFLFHMVWEANSRYIFPYFLLLLPYAARGLGMARKAFRPRKNTGLLP